MSDETPEPGVDEPTADGADEAVSAQAGEQAEPAARRPAASAASRARRIGGRPMPGPRPASAEPAARPATTSTTTKPAKPAKPPREPKPARAVDAAALQRRLDRLRWIPAGIAAVAVLAALGVGAWQSHGVWWGDKIQSHRGQQQQQVLAAAKSCAVALLSFDYRSLDAAQKKGDQCTYGDNLTKYDQTFNTIVREVAPQRKSSQTMQIANGGVQSVSGDGKQWVVLLFGQLTYADNTQPANTPRLDVATFAVTMTKVNNAWLVTKMDPTG